MRLKIREIGTGSISHYHTRAAQLLPEMELAASGIDAVSINTPNSLHAPQTVAALDVGVQLLVERPKAVNTTQANEMQAASQRSGAHLMAAYCWRSDEEVVRRMQPCPEGEREDEVVPGHAHPRDERCPQLMYDTQMAHFIDRIRKNHKPNPGGAEGWINMLIVDAASQSSLSGELAAIA